MEELKDMRFSNATAAADNGDPHHPQKPPSDDVTTDTNNNPSPTLSTSQPKLNRFFSFQPKLRPSPPPAAAAAVYEFQEKPKMINGEIVKEHGEQVSEDKDSILVAKKRKTPFQENENFQSNRGQIHGQHELLSEIRSPFEENDDVELEGVHIIDQHQLLSERTNPFEEDKNFKLKGVQISDQHQLLSERISPFEDNDDIEVAGVQIVDQHQLLCERMSQFEEDDKFGLKGVQILDQLQPLSERMSPFQENDNGQLKGVQIQDHHQPLSERMRPRTLEDIVGQDHLLSSDNLIKSGLERGRLPSIILWGPPGCGKTTIAKAIVNSTKESCSYRFVSLSAVTCGVKDVRDVADEARKWKKEDSVVGLIGNSSKGTILFIDEVHRFNKGQQDSLLPVIEDGSVVFIGATTENPSFHLNTPLLSRCRVLTLNPLKPEDIVVVLRRAVSDVQKGLLCSIPLREVSGIEANDEAISFLSENTDGDVRVALNALEISATTATARLRLLGGNSNGIEGNGDAELPSAPTCVITLSDVKEALQCKHIAYDRDGEEHYNQISALHKSMRGSDPDAAIYWLARMLEGGEQPLYIARRLIRFACEDVGLADPSALIRAVDCYQACHFLGMPGCDVILTQCVSYLSLAPKSIAVYKALQAAQKVVRESVGQNERMPLQDYISPTENPDIADTQSLPPSLQGYKFLDWPSSSRRP